VNPNRAPLITLHIPTVASSLFVSNASPISMLIAATSKHDANDTTKLFNAKKGIE
jgi:hypothetical protein